MRAVYRTMIKRCPDCNMSLRAYRGHARHVISAEYGSYIAVHKIKRCKSCGRLFRSEALVTIIEP